MGMMLQLALWSALSGVVIGAPVGVAGALVADSALAHNLRRLLATIFGVALGDTTLAFAVAYFTDSTDRLITEYECGVYLGAGIFLLLIGVVMLIFAYRNRNSSLKDPAEFKGVWHYLLSHAGPAVTAFAVAAFHPGNVLVMLPLCRGVIARIGAEAFVPWVFALGLGLGSFMIFAFSAFLFWKIRMKAGKFVSMMRLSLAVIVLGIGVYFMFKYALATQQKQEADHEQTTSLS